MSIPVNRDQLQSELALSELIDRAAQALTSLITAARAAQQRGEVARIGDNLPRISNGNSKPTAADLGLTHKQVHEARAGPPNTASIPRDQLLTRTDLAAALTALGFKTSPASLSTLASRGGGPRFRKFGPRVVYAWGDGLDWAQARLSKRVTSTSEFRHEGDLHP